MEENCGGCRSWCRNDGESDGGVCRRYPWPQAKQRDDWCREWEDRGPNPECVTLTNGQRGMWNNMNEAQKKGLLFRLVSQGMEPLANALVDYEVGEDGD